MAVSLTAEATCLKWPEPFNEADKHQKDLS